MDLPENINRTSNTTALIGHKDTSCEKSSKESNRKKKKLRNTFDKCSHPRARTPYKRRGTTFKKRKGCGKNVNTTINQTLLNDGQNTWIKGK